LRDASLAALATYVTDGVSEPVCYALPEGLYYLQEVDPPGYRSVGPNWYGAALLNEVTIALGFADVRVQSTPTGTATIAATASRTVTPTVTPSRTPTDAPTPGASIYLPLVWR
jgi:hypothetical protein